MEIATNFETLKFTTTHIQSIGYPMTAHLDVNY